VNDEVKEEDDGKESEKRTVLMKYREFVVFELVFFFMIVSNARRSLTLRDEEGFFAFLRAHSLS